MAGGTALAATIQSGKLKEIHFQGNLEMAIKFVENFCFKLLET